MRSQEERVKFCADSILVARKCRIGLSRYENRRFSWLDPVVGIVISGPENDNQELALEAACESLIDYFNKPHP